MWQSLYRVIASPFESGHGSRTTVPAIEGLRGFAALLVFFAHYVTLIEPWMDRETATWIIARLPGAVGHSGVDLFFLLSGYLIYGGLIRRREPLGQYFLRRVKRIYPTFTAVFALYVAACLLVPSQSKLPPDFEQAAIYLVINFLLLAEIVGVPPLITVSWSLSFEMLFYVVCPIFVMCFGLREWKTWARSLLIVVVASAMLALAPFLKTYTRTAMFLVGMLCFETLPRLQNWKHTWIYLFAFVGGTVAVLAVSAQDLGPRAWTMATILSFLPLCYGSLQRDANLLTSTFIWTPLRWFGNMSYSFFLLHGLTLKATFFLIERTLSAPVGDWNSVFWLLLPVAFGIALLPSIALFLTIERRFSLMPAPAISAV